MTKLYKVKITRDDGIDWAEDATALPGFGACPTSSADESYAGKWPRAKAERIARSHRGGSKVVELVPA
ncbi:MAG: hypothetical protein KAI86_05590 [Desulfobacterales bacterium]|nr:hypothetical protein [Desulfobacterales bacterium]